MINHRFSPKMSTCQFQIPTAHETQPKDHKHQRNYDKNIQAQAPYHKSVTLPQFYFYFCLDDSHKK